MSRKILCLDPDLTRIENIQRHLSRVGVECVRAGYSQDEQRYALSQLKEFEMAIVNAEVVWTRPDIHLFVYEIRKLSKVFPIVAYADASKIMCCSLFKRVGASSVITEDFLVTYLKSTLDRRNKKLQVYFKERRQAA
ncbi:hypothetical protein ISS03_01645 [Patescibacteria group bacterium]|nr:hypothetical protein [Patescibacteria group bacterium]